MKKIILFLVAAAFALSLVSCKTMLPVTFEKFVDYVEKNADSFSEEDWQKADKTFHELMDEYKAHSADLSKEDRERIDKAIGKYYAVALKSNIGGIIESAKEVVDGIRNSVGSWLEELTK